MTGKVPVVSPSSTLLDVQAYLSKKIDQLETIDYIYVADKQKKLIGVFSIKELYTYPAETKVGAISSRDHLASVTPQTKLEEVSYIALKHGIKAVPVLDDNGIFLGTVSNDTIFANLRHEHHRELLRLAGIHEAHLAFDDTVEIPVSLAIKHRAPWLFVGLGGGLLAAEIIGYFEHTLKQNIILAAFIPLVVYIADAVGTQLESLMIRDFALYRKLNFTKYFIKQFLTVFIIAILLGLAITLASLLLHDNVNISIVLGAAIISAVLSSLVTGLFIPYMFRSLKFDPANASGPIATIIQDVLSISIYFLIASILL